MNISKKLFALIAISLSVATITYSQHYKYCGTTQAVEQSLKEHPEYIISQQELEEYTQSYVEQSGMHTESQAPVYVIPVVFHVLHKYGAENISDAQIHDAMAILNRDFRKKNSDTSSIVTAFKSIAADCEIEFKLAQKDPSGNCTNGIDRIVSDQTNIGDDGSKLNYWAGNKYLNIWVVNTIQSGAAGYSYLPGTAPPNKDGILILHDYVGSIGTGTPVRSRALGHEVGHYLNLLHPWGSSNSPGVACGNDNVSDTPVTEGWTSCNLTTNDICNAGIEENVQNYMEYSYCTKMFTAGQKTRMRAALTSATAGRNNLWTTTNLAATGTDGSGPALCAPVADFMASSIYTCANSPITFTDLSWKGAPSSWSWSFPGGTPSTSTVSNPSVTYATPGVYTVSLTAINGTGSDSEVKTGYVTVYPSVATYSTAPFTEGFEGSAVPNADWNIYNHSGGVTWAQTSTAKYNGSKSLMINNISNSVGAVDDLISPSFDISKMPGPLVSFKLAYVQRNANNDDMLEVYATSDCGKTWNQRYNKAGVLLATTTMQASTFTPTSQSQWRNEYVMISPFIYATNVKLMFKFTNDGGNNIFIDDINITATTAGIVEEVVKNSLSVFPNPASNFSTVMFMAPENGKVTISVVDVLGRNVSEVYSENVSAGQQQHTIDTSLLSKGMYYVNVIFEGVSVTKTLIVSE